jgi:osmoprotectant transport system permease protein
MGRKDGDIGLKKIYQLDVNPSVVNDALMYKALYEGKLDLISGYSTDGRIKAYDLWFLNDDKKIFPPYFAAPIVKEKTLQKYPDLEKTLNLLSGKINDSVMTELNYQTDYLHQVPEKVAKEFLKIICTKHLKKQEIKPSGSDQKYLENNIFLPKSTECSSKEIQTIKLKPKQD